MHLHSHHGHAPHPHDTLAQNQRMARLATYASVAMAMALLSGKIWAWWISDSLAMLSSLTDSFFDVVTSTINLIALRYALKPADDDHRFGHTSIEDIAGLAQFAFISASMMLIILQSLERLSNPRVVEHETLGLWVSGIAMLFTIALVIYQTIVTRRTGSLIIAADRLHYLGDVLFNLGVMIALVLSARYGLLWADPAMAILIAVLILFSSRSIGIRAFNNLMDREMPDTEKQKIQEVLKTIPEVRQVHNLKTRCSGTKYFIQMHAEIDDAIGFRDAHAITDRLEQALLAAFPGAEVIIHPDPVSVVGTNSNPA